MGSITAKFGGTSLASAAMVRQAAAIINREPRRRFIVPSAPGKRTPVDKKITDLLPSFNVQMTPGPNGTRIIIGWTKKR